MAMTLHKPATNINEPKLSNFEININDMIDDVPYELEVINQDANYLLQDPFDNQGVNVDLLPADVLMSDTVQIIDLNNTRELLHESNESIDLESLQIQEVHLKEHEDKHEDKTCREFTQPQELAHTDDDSDEDNLFLIQLKDKICRPENLEEPEDNSDPDFIPPPKESDQDDSEYSDEEENEDTRSLVQSKDEIYPQENTENLNLVQDAVLTDTRITEKKRKKKGNSELWDKNVNKRKRMMGEEYIGYTRSKDGTIKHDIKRNKRRLGPKCISNFCKKAANRFCHLLSEEIRQTIFEKFWSMSWEQKRLYVLHMTSYNERKRSYTKDSSRRKGSFQYYLKIEAGKHQVCKHTFLGTLGIKERMVRHWVNEGSVFGTLSKQDDINNNKTKKKNTSVHSVEQNKKLEYLRQFLDSLPKMESHYCRKKSNKLYLEEDFKSKTDIFQLYKNKCLDEDVLPLSISTFLKEFDEMNLALFKPRKDQCDLCCGYKMHQIEESVYQDHILAKDHARKEKDLDKKKAEDQAIYCFTMDVQAVKLCPQLQASALYYKTKLQVHNFTIYNLSTHACKNFVWNETEGELCCSVFVTCIVKHLAAVLETDKKPIVLYSDSCGYQNKNNVLSNALSILATKFDTVIEQKFLEKGHTQMECDSSHSLIERRLKGKDIFLPTDYINIIKDARKKPVPLEVEYLDHSYFLNFDNPNLMRYNSIRPGKLKSPLKVTDIRCLKYLPSGEILFKTKYDDPYAFLPQRQKGIILDEYKPQPLYGKRLEISKKKWLDLQQLKKVIPKDTHYFYDMIKYYEKTEETKNKKTNNTEIQLLSSNNENTIQIPSTSKNEPSTKQQQKKSATKKTDTKKTDTKNTDTKKTDTKRTDTKKTDTKKADTKNKTVKKNTKINKKKTN